MIKMLGVDAWLFFGIAIILILMIIVSIMGRVEKIWYFLKHDPGELGRQFRKSISKDKQQKTLL